MWPTQGQTNWVSVDPPRVWDMLRNEDDARGWEQVKALRAMASLLMAQAEKLARHREALAHMWPADHSPAASVALKRIDSLIAWMREDGEAAIQNALAIDGIMAATAKAKHEVHNVVEDWELTTEDGGPEWWDREAARLSYLTEQTMNATERAIRDHRSTIVMPAVLLFREPMTMLGGPEPGDNPPPPPPPPGGGRPRPARVVAGDMGAPVVPPTLPGYPPLITDPSGAPSPDLQGSLPPVLATPGQPVSMLPIAPGNPYAPYGGAYVLPGPGVGPNGYVVALPQPGSGGAATISTPARGANSGAPGLMPMPMAGPGGQLDRGGAGSAGRRNGDTRWEVAGGVPPIIQPANPTVPAGSSPEQVEEDFRQWFTQTAMPWRTEPESSAQAPVVTIRRGTPAP